MKIKLRNIFFVAALSIVGPCLSLQAVGASDFSNQIWKSCSSNPNSAVCRSTGDNATNTIKNIINVLLYGLGIVAVIAIIIGGFVYVTSNGDAAKIKKAKDIILYAVIGLVVALLAFAIVNFVIQSMR